MSDITGNKSVSSVSINDDASAVYDDIFSYRDDFGFYKWAAQHYGGPILEVGCGTGRILVPMAQDGYDILGIDPNVSQVKRCVERIANELENSSANAIVGSILDFQSDRRFALVTTPFRSFQHLLTPEDQIKAMTNIWNHLEPGGHCILDVFNPSIQLLANDGLKQEFGDGQVIDLKDGRKVELRNRIVERDYIKQLQSAEEIYVFTMPDGTTSRTILSYQTRYTFRYEYEHMVAAIGFEILDVFGGYDRTSFGKNYPGEILMVLRRPE